MNTTPNAAAEIVTAREGRRTWISGPTKPFRDQLCRAGAHWDPARVAWWIGSDAEAKTLVAKLNAMLRGDHVAAAERHAAQMAQANQARADWLANPINTKYIYTAKDKTWIIISTPYSDTLVDLAKSIPGRRYDADSKVSVYPFTSAPQIREAAPKIEAAIQALQAAKDAQEASKLAIRGHRFLALMSDCPAIGSTIRHNGEAVTIESRGKIFRINEGMSSVYGSWLLGREGEACCYVYYVPATPADAAKLEQREAEDAAARQIRQAAHARLAELQAYALEQAVFQAEDVELTGEVIFHDRAELMIYGGGTTWALAGGKIWVIETNGADGDDWGANHVSLNGGRLMLWPLDAAQPGDRGQNAGRGAGYGRTQASCLTGSGSVC